MPTTAELKQLSPELRRRNRRLGWLLFFIVLACAVWTAYPVHKGWVYPQDVTYAWPHWLGGGTTTAQSAPIALMGPSGAGTSSSAKTSHQTEPK